MTDCSSLLDSSTGSSDITSSLGKNRRIRIVRLTRPRVQSLTSTTLLSGNSNTSFGFSLRGGREFGTGFFVSKVEKGSEAEIQDLRVSIEFVFNIICYVMLIAFDSRSVIKSSASIDTMWMMLFTRNYPSISAIRTVSY